jgi:hypothetical protein
MNYPQTPELLNLLAQVWELSAHSQVSTHDILAAMVDMNDRITGHQQDSMGGIMSLQPPLKPQQAAAQPQQAAAQPQQAAAQPQQAAAQPQQAAAQPQQAAAQPQQAAAAAQPEQAAAAQPEQTGPQSMTFDELVAAVQGAWQDTAFGGRSRFVAAMQAFGIRNLSDLKPEQYVTFAEQVNTAG